MIFVVQKICGMSQTVNHKFNFINIYGTNVIAVIRIYTYLSQDRFQTMLNILFYIIFWKIIDIKTISSTYFCYKDRKK